MEVEAKFSLPDWATFDRLCRLNELIGYRLEQAAVQQVHDCYLDTDDRAILRAGYACRLRRKGASPVRRSTLDANAKLVEGETCVATLKELGGADADSGIHQRAEYEVPVDDVDYNNWPDSPARDLALRLSDGRPLRELFSLNQERHLRVCSRYTAKGTRRVAELSLDVVTPDEALAPLYYELEIELLDQGDESDLYALAGELGATWALQPELCSKFERGLELLDKSKTELSLLPELKSPGLLPDDPMSKAGRKMLWFNFVRMLKHEPGTRAGKDIEELHDMRVATRRMRAAMRVFGDFFEPKAIAPFKKGIRRVTRALGPVRDLDVFEEKAGHYLQTLPETARDGLDPLLEIWHAQRKVARENMVIFLDSDRYRKFKRSFADFLQTEGAGARRIRRDQPVPYLVRHVAPRLIYTRYETVRAYNTVLEDAKIETLHALRIDCKYLRYTLEFLRETLGTEGELVIKEIKRMQDHLGDLNDAEVAINLLNEFLSEWDNVPLSQVVTYLNARRAEKQRLLTTFSQAWADFNRDEVRRWLALAVAAL